MSFSAVGRREGKGLGGSFNMLEGEGVQSWLSKGMGQEART